MWLQGRQITMPTEAELRSLVTTPREDLGVEYKDWLDPSSNHGRATVARAAIALANHGGGFIVIGFAEREGSLISQPKPDTLMAITQDQANAAIRRFADPEFHAEVYGITHPDTGVEHIIILVPGGHAVPVMSRRDCEGVIAQNRCYIRKPGPRSEEPQTREEWRALLNRCVQAQREDMLDAIRAIVTGRVDVVVATPSVEERFDAFVSSSRQRWEQLVADLPPESPSRFPHGSYELAFGLVGAEPCSGLAELQDRLAVARRVKLTGWSTFLQMSTPGWAPYPHDNFVEAWVGRPIKDDAQSRDPSLCDFWRASRFGQLYTIRGYSEDGLDNRRPGTCLDVTLPVWRVGEGLLFAARLAETFNDVEQIVIHCRYKGLRGRALASVVGRYEMLDHTISQTDEISLRGQATPTQIRDNLAEVLLPLLMPLYERFDFFRLSSQLVGEEAQRLQQRRF
jgi:hypothetical protein